MNKTFDGDKCSATIVYSDDALEEIRKYLSSKAAVLDPRGGLQFANTDTLEWVLISMTSGS